MSKLYILLKGKETIHTYSDKLKKEYITEGYSHIATVWGWNMSVDHHK